MSTLSGHSHHERYRRTFFFRWSLITAILLLTGLGFAHAAVAAPGEYNVRDYGAKGDGVTSDTAAFQQAIDRAAIDGGTVSVPSGTFLIGTSLSLRSGIRIAGNAGQTILTMPANGSSRFIIEGTGLQNVVLEGLAFKASSLADKVSGLYMVGARNCRLSMLRFDNLVVGMKLGSGPVAIGWRIEDIVARNCGKAIFASYLEDSSFSRLDLQAALGSNTQEHTVYLEREIHRLTFTDVTLSGGSGYCLQMYLEGGTSSDIAFQNLVLDATIGRYPLVIWGGWSNIVFRNVIIKARPNTGPCVQLEAPQDITFDGLSVSGGSTLVKTYAGQADHAQRITFKNGNYDGPALPTSDSGIDGLVIENVTLGAAGTTTAATTTTVTVPMVALTTTTTMPPTTTTTVPVAIVPTPSPLITATFLSPALNGVVRSRVQVTASVIAQTRISSVTFYIDGAKKYIDSRASYGFTWDTRTYTTGAHVLKAVALDRYGRSVTTQMTVYVTR